MNRPAAVRLLFLALLVTVFLPSGTGWSIHPREMEFGPLDWDPPEPGRVVMDNGLVVYFLEDDEVPLVEVTLYFRTGSVYDPAEKSGLARLAGRLVHHGGTARRSPEQIDYALDMMAADLEVYVRGTYIAVAFSVLKKDVDEGLDLLADLLRRPAFDPERVDLYRQERLEEIRRRYDRPGRIAAGEFRKMVYSSGSPWSRMATAGSISSIKRGDLIRFHQRYFRPNNCIVSICGDLTGHEMIRKIGAVLGDWESGNPTLPLLPKLEWNFVAQTGYVERAISQSYIRVGHLGYRYHDPEEFGIEMMNYILGGGGFLSRLSREIRSRRGLAYSILSRLDPGEDLGLFEIRCQTDAATTHETLTLILQIIHEIVENPPGAEELERAKEARINEFVFAFDSRARIVRQAAWLEYRGYPEGYLDHWVDRVRAVTAEDVHRAARRLLHPDGLTILVVGNESRFDRPLCEFGEVNRIDLSIPCPFPGEKP
ncbi:MAG: insulinase family protein [Candidatus Eisenbacteria sp.]|nr:insulinase family protein [Candidatus Eisenbacteria bacterium]